MELLPIRRNLLKRYLNILWVPRQEPSLEFLAEVVKAHMLRIPFENVSKLYYKKRLGLNTLPDLELFLDGIERFNFGGTCYANNFYLYQLLATLGFEAMLCGADMSKPDAHLMSMVRLQQREYLIDVGYAAPFITPLPRDLAEDYTVALGRDRYVLKPRDANGCSRLEFFRDGNLKHGYLAKPAPRRIQEFEPGIAGSYGKEATFMNTLLLARFSPGRSVVINNLAVVESQDAASRIRTLASLDALVRAVHEYFEIPVKITRDAVKDLGQLGDPWS